MHHGLKLTLTLVLAGAVLAGNGWASATARAVGSYDGAKVRVIQETFSGIRIGFDLSQATLTPVATVAESAAEPELVSAPRWVVVPDRGAISLKACRNGTAHLGNPQIFRGVRMAPVTVSSPLDSPNEVELELEFTAGIGVNELGALSRVPITPQFANLLESVAINPPRDRFPSRDLAAESLSRMLLLYPEAIEDQATLDLIQEFADWKRRLGLRVDVEAIDTDAMDAEAIKGVISDYYHEDPPIDYVVIIGDDRFPKTYLLQDPPPFDQELFFPGYPKTLHYDNLDTTHLVDLVYTTMDGDQDMAPDIGIGRFWVRTLDQLRGALRRSIVYESDPYMGPEGDGAWMGRALITMEADSLNATARKRDMLLWEKQQLTDMNYGTVSVVSDLSDVQVCEEVKSRLEEEGASLYISDYCFLGALLPFGSWLEIADTDRMNPYCIGNVAWYDDWLFYAFFGSCTEDTLRGPIGGLTSFRNPPPALNFPTVAAAAVRGMKYQEQFHPGGLFQLAAMNLAALSYREGLPDYYNVERDFYTLHSFGDPSLDLFTAAPTQLTASYADNLNSGATSFSLVARDEQNNGVDNATVCIRQEGGIQYVALTGPDGVISFTIPDGLQAGTLQITVHKHNYRPYLTDVPVEAPLVNLALGEHGFDDSALGDNDGRFRNGEEAALVLSLHNSSDGDAHNANAILSCDSPYLIFSTNQLAFGDIDAGQSASFQGNVSITLDPDCPGGTVLAIQAAVTCDEGTYPVAFEITSSGPRLFTNAGIISVENLAPDSSATLTPLLGNLGDLGSGELNAVLTSIDTLVTITEANKSYPNIEPAGTASPNESFKFDLSPLFIRGDSVHFELMLFNENGAEVAFSLALRVPDPAEGDPLGPDRYGYICYDSEDRNWPEAPNYNWREINWDVDNYEFKGTRLDLGDLGFAGDWDSSAVVRLPFPFKYYGQDFDSITVCSNGWMAMGSNAVFFSSGANQAISSYGASYGQICPFWEELRNNSEDYHGVFYHYIADEGVFVVEWSQVQDGDTVLTYDQTFQVLLRDPQIYQTPTGDGEIIFQYREFSNPPGNVNVSYPYPTVGIANLTGDDGIQYSYWNEYPPQAHPIQNEFAIKFTTRFVRVGAVKGKIVRLENQDQAIAGARILDYRFTQAVSDSSGNFLISDLYPGRYEGIVVSDSGFNDAVIAFDVTPGETADLGNIAMTYPQINIREDAMYPLPFDQLSLRPDGSQLLAKLLLDNNGNGPLEYSARLIGADPAGERFENIRTIGRLDTLFSAKRACYGVVYVDSLFYIAGLETSQADKHFIYILSWDGRNVGKFLQPNRDNSDDGIYGLAWDGSNFWGGMELIDANRYLVEFDRQGTPIKTIASPLTEDKYLSVVYAPQRNTLFLANQTSNQIVEVDTNGNELNRIEVHRPAGSFKFSGLAWNQYDPDEMYLYLSEDSIGADNVLYSVIHKMNPASGDRMRLGYFAGDSVGTHRGLTFILNQDYTKSLVAVIDDNAPPRAMPRYLRIYDAGPNFGLLAEGRIRNRTGIIAPAQQSAVEILIEANDWPEGEYRFNLEISSNAAGEPLLFTMMLSLNDTTGLPDGGSPAVPLEFGIRALYPNPFNSEVRIEFALPDSRLTTVKAYDLTGREVAVIFDETAQAGLHRMVWDGSRLASGVYFIRLEAGGRAQTAKLALVR